MSRQESEPHPLQPRRRYFGLSVTVRGPLLTARNGIIMYRNSVSIYEMFQELSPQFVSQMPMNPNLQLFPNTLLDLLALHGDLLYLEGAS
jgi:hypothetical protein